MTDKRYTLVNDYGDYHIKKGDEELCYDLCSPTMAKENWNNVLKELNALHEESQSQKDFINQLQDELVMFKNAGADMSKDFNFKIMELKQENGQLKKEAKHQQGQKQRLRNYLRQYLTSDEIKKIMNDDKWLSSEELEKELEE